MGTRAGAPRSGDVARRPGVGGPAAGPGALERRGGRSEAGFSTRFDRCQRRKRFPLLIAGVLTAKRAFVCSEEEVE